MNTDLPITVTALRFSEDRRLYALDYLLALLLDGEMALRDGPQRQIEPGTMLFLSPFIRGKLYVKAGSSVVYGVIPADFLESMVGSPKQTWAQFTLDRENHAVEKLVGLFDLKYNRTPRDPMGEMIEGLELLRALATVVTGAEDARSATQENDLQRQDMVRYVVYSDQDMIPGGRPIRLDEEPP